MKSRKGLSRAWFHAVDFAGDNKESIITASLLIYVAFYFIAGFGGISFQAQPALAYEGQPCTYDSDCDETGEVCVSGSCTCGDSDGDSYDQASCGGQDCDDSDSNQNPDTTWYYDGDSDGWHSDTTTQCSDPGVEWHLSSGGQDCNDSNGNIYPGATDSCNGVDNDCDGTTDDDSSCGSAYCATSEDAYYYCSGGDYYKNYDEEDPECQSGSCQTVVTHNSCGATQVEDCGSEESCSTSQNGCYCTDDDGDGYTDSACGGQDCNDSDSNQNPDTTWYKDADGDGYHSSTTTQCGDPGSNWYMSSSGQDCDDSDSATNPGASEVCDNKDNDCDSTVDEDRAGVANTVCMKVSTESNSAAPAGSAWIEGNRFHWANGSIEYKAENSGNTVATGLSKTGSLWIEGAYIHWIDANGNERRFYGVDTGTDISGESGSIWIENGKVHYVDANGNERIVS